MCQRLKLDPYLILYTKIISKWTRDLNIKHEVIKVLGENLEVKLLDIGFGIKNFWQRKFQVHLASLLFNNILEVLARAISQAKEI